MIHWPVPQTPKELSSFLWFTGYYRSFIPEYSKLTCEMKTQKTMKQLEWTESMDEQFRILKEHFGKWPLRSYPLYGEDSEKFEMRTDFSPQSLGAVLQQVRDGQKHFIAAIGRKTTKGEKIYPPTKGELAAIMYALWKWKHILRFQPF